MLKTHVISAIPFPERITRYTSPKEWWEFLTWVWLPGESCLARALGARQGRPAGLARGTCRAPLLLP